MSFAQYVESDRIRRLEDQNSALKRQLAKAKARIAELEGDPTKPRTMFDAVFDRLPFRNRSSTR